MSVMTEEQLIILKSEHHVSMERKRTDMHRQWRLILDEYKFDTEWDLYSYMLETIENSQQLGSLAVNGRVPKMNIIIRKLLALMSITEPSFRVEAGQPGDEPVSWVLEKYFEDFMNRIKFTKMGRELILHTALWGTGIAKVGWGGEYVYGEVPWSRGFKRKRVIEEINELDMPYGPTTEYANPSLLEDQVVWNLVFPHDFVTDPMARVEKEVRRFYHRQSRPVIDIWYDSRYSDERFNVRGEIPEEYEDTPFNDFWKTECDAEAERAEVVEVFDVASRQYAVFHHDLEKPLKDWTPFPLPVKHPYQFLRFIENPTSFWGIPYALMLLPSTTAENVSNMKVLSQIERDGKRLVLWDDTMEGVDDDFLVDVAEAPHEAHMKLSGIGQSQNPPFQIIEFGGANPEMLRMQGVFASNTDYASGLDDPSRNAYRDKDTTATEVHTRQQQQGLSIDFFRELYEEFLEDSANDIARIVLENWDAEQLVRIVGDDVRVSFWVPLERERVQDTFTLRIHAGSTQPLDKVSYRKQLIELMPRITEAAAQIDQEQMQSQQMMMQTGQPWRSAVNREELLRIVLENFDPRLADRILRRKDPVEMLQRLMEQTGIQPIDVSPALQEQAAQRGMTLPGPQPQAGGNVLPFPGGAQPSFEEANRVPAPGAPNEFEAFPTEQGSGQVGRMLSEIAGQ